MSPFVIFSCFLFCNVFVSPKFKRSQKEVRQKQGTEEVEQKRRRLESVDDVCLQLDKMTFG